MKKPPITGMTLIPLGAESPPKMMGFLSFLMFSASQPECRELFKKETGHDLDKLLNRTPIDEMIDQATGHEKTVFIAFADWITKTAWGVEEEEVESSNSTN